MIQAVEVMLATTYRLHYLGITSPWRSSESCFRTLVCFLSPLQSSKTANRSSLTESSKLEVTLTSRSRNLKSGFWILFSSLFNRLSCPGRRSSICSTFFCNYLSQPPASSPFEFSLSISSPVPWTSFMLVIKRLACLWRTIFSTLFGKPDHDGVSVILISLIHFW